jgi:hypothetical protein
MRVHGLRLSLCALFCVFGIAGAGAMPISSEMSDLRHRPLMSRVQWECNRDGCFNQRTGDFTASGCNSRGCYPTSEVKGRMTRRGPAYYDPRDVPDAYRRPSRRAYGAEDDYGERRSRRYQEW